ncbi:hypothetical protein C8F04DRAFT_1247349 [Mycena alexandri]|uniref:Uncharacterized protein n=1 Tax=Mycena alexandri TaxID=1745969 RepID=A0AAD6TJX1_9AGAR|nr:hypothetical protein C8F04DRAFT_1247349 [Mycena alexandri]
MAVTLKSAIKHWYAPEVIPIVLLYVDPLPRALPIPVSLVQWSRKNSEPWNSIQPGQGVKMVQVNHKFNRRFGPPLEKRPF